MSHALYAPSGTPTAVINKLNAAVNAGLASPELKATLTEFGFKPNAGSPQELGTFMVDQVGKSPSIIKATGVRPD